MAKMSVLLLQGKSQAAADAVAAAVSLPIANAGVIIQALAQTVRAMINSNLYPLILTRIFSAFAITVGAVSLNWYCHVQLEGSLCSSTVQTYHWLCLSCYAQVLYTVLVH